VNYWPYIAVFVLLIAFMAFSRRTRHRQMLAEQARAERIGFGTEVMTTSGLYGTVTSRNDDDTVQLVIAPGVEVRWAVAALRDVQSLPDRYRGTAGRNVDGTDDGADGPSGHP
jgi:preprotein translocase subunit YajC